MPAASRPRTRSRTPSSPSRGVDERVVVVGGSVFLGLFLSLPPLSPFSVVVATSLAGTRKLCIARPPVFLLSRSRESRRARAARSRDRETSLHHAATRLLDLARSSLARPSSCLELPTVLVALDGLPWPVGHCRVGARVGREGGPGGEVRACGQGGWRCGSAGRGRGRKSLLVSMPRLFLPRRERGKDARG